MALSKEIELGNGVKTTYHRVVSVTNVTNEQTVVEVASYTGRDMREKEKGMLAAARAAADEPYEEDMDVYVSTVYHDVPYDEDMTVGKAYEAVKALPEFEGALDA